MILNNSDEAIKAATVALELSRKNNQRLLAMSHLVLAEANCQNRSFVEAQRHLADAKLLEKQIDHRYVQDRREAVEDLMRDFYDLRGRSFKEAEKDLMGWFIEHRTSKENVTQVAAALEIDPGTVKRYLKKLPSTSEFHHLVKDLKERGKPGPKKRPVRAPNDNSDI